MNPPVLISRQPFNPYTRKCRPSSRARNLVAVLIRLSVCSRSTLTRKPFTVIASNAAPLWSLRAERIAEALTAVKLNATIVPFRCEEACSRDVRPNAGSQRREKDLRLLRLRTGWERESFVVSQRMDGNTRRSHGKWTIQACFMAAPELAKRIRRLRQAAGRYGYSRRGKMTLQRHVRRDAEDLHPARPQSLRVSLHAGVVPVVLPTRRSGPSISTPSSRTA